MTVTIPTVAVDPAGIQSAADRIRAGGDATAEQADLVVHTWTGLGAHYLAPEGQALTTALTPVARSAGLHRTRLASVSTALDLFSHQAESIIRQLDDLRVQAAGADAFAAAELEARAGVLMSQLEDAEQTCAAGIRAAVGGHDDTPFGLSSDLGFLALLAGDKAPFLGANYLDTPLEFAMLTHFVTGTGGEYVLSAEDVAAVRDDLAVRQAGDAIRAGQTGAAVPVTLEDGRSGLRVDIDFKQPVAGRTDNPFDGSIGRGRVFFDLSGNFVGISDSYDFTNGGEPVDLVNLAAGATGAKSFLDRGGVIEQTSEDPEVAVQPDVLTAAWRLFQRTVLGQDPGPYTGPRPDLTTGRTPS